MKTVTKFIAALIVLSASIFSSNAQSMVSGVVKDAVGNVTLPSASIVVKGTATSTITDLNGEYRLPLKAGTYTLVASFIGYTKKEQVVVVVDKKDVIVNFSLDGESIMGKEITITAMMLGQKAAISSQLNAAGIVNAVSEKQIQELPDANAGDALGRLPGISLKRSGGEAQNIVLRGLNEKFSSIQLNGVQVPSTDGASRGVDLSMFSLSSLAGIEVTKALTPDMDADAIAGSVNLVTKKASSSPKFRIDLGGGYNDIEKNASQYNIALRYERRFLNNLLGMQLSVNSEQRIRSNESYAQGWLIEGKDVPEINDFTLSYTDEKRKRRGVSLLLDFDTKDKGTIRFNNFYSHSDRDFVNYSRYYGIKTSDVSYNIEDKERDIETFNNSISGENYIKKLKIKWGASHALTIGNTPFDHIMEFYEGGTTNTGIDVNSIPDQEYYDIIRTGPGSRITPYAFNNYSLSTLKTAYFKPSKSMDRDLVGYVDFERKFTISQHVDITLKSGVKSKNKIRSNKNDVYRAYYTSMEPYSNSILEDGTIVPADYSNTSFANLKKFGGSVLLTNFIDDPATSRQIFNGQYELTPMVNSGLAREWYNTHKNAVNSDGSDYEYRAHPSGISENYSVREQVNSAYLMATTDFGKMLRVIAGVRIESENNSYTAVYAPEVYSMTLFTKEDIKDTTRTYHSTYILPSFHIRFKPVEWFDLRLAATKTLARPDFTMRLPTLVIGRGDVNTIYKGFTGLNNTEAWNFDAIASFYKSKYGLFTAGAFYKKLDNVFYTLNDVVISNNDMVKNYELPTGPGIGSYKGMRLTSPVNTNNTTVKGLEFDLQANLTFLPGFLRYLVLRGNYSVIKSITYIPRFRIDLDKSKIPYVKTPVFYETEETLEGQPSNFGNIALGYDRGGFSARLSVFFQGDYIASVSSNEKLDVMQKGYQKWDLALKQEIKKFNAELMLNISNISNMQEGTYYRYLNMDRGGSISGMLIDAGIRINL
jgi:TonB-dependent receptor